MRLFADDSKVYKIINDENDEKKLQCDHNTLQKWSENWQLRFHPDKCEVLRVTHARDHTRYAYQLSDCTLQSVTETVDLGVSLTSNLSWNTQAQKVVNKANKIVGFLKRNVSPGNKEVFSRQYKALVIPILKYAVPLWSPYLQMNIDALEQVQRRASKYALPMSSRDSPNEERLAMLGWSSLQSRRSYLSLLKCYKTIHGLKGFNCNDYFEFNCYGRTKSNHSFKLRQPLARVNCFLHSFFVRIIKLWNALPKKIVL